jgi:RNA methyltransferase, TrmH family
MLKTERITSEANPLLKEIRRAVNRGSLTAGGFAVAEGPHLLDEALRSGCAVHAVLAAERAIAQIEALGNRLIGVRVIAVPDGLFDDLAATESTQGVIALVTPVEAEFDHLLGGSPLVVVLDGLQDPGNVGAIARAAEAFGATGAILVKGTASPHNPKALRASAGSLLRLRYVQGMDAADTIEALHGAGLRLFAAMPPAAGSQPIAPGAADLTVPCALVLGNEAHGVSRAFRDAAVPLSIPTTGVESLNAAVAAGILLYEVRRQRTLKA